MFWLMLFFSSFAFAEEKYPSYTIVEVEVQSCRGGNGDRLDLTAKITRDKIVELYKLRQDHTWQARKMLDPKPYVVLNTRKISCDQLVAKKFNVFQWATKSEACQKKSTAKWYCRHEDYNLLIYSDWLDQFK